MNKSYFEYKYLKYKNKYLKELQGGAGNINLIIGAGPIGLYLCRYLLQQGEQVILIEQRDDISLITRNQILLITNANFNLLINLMGESVMQHFGKVGPPPISNSGMICEVKPRFINTLQEPKLYTIPINSLQNILKENFGGYISSRHLIFYQPNVEQKLTLEVNLSSLQLLEQRLWRLHQ